MRSPAPTTGRTGGSGLSGPGCSRSGGADGRKDLRRRGPAQPGSSARMGSEQRGYGVTTRCRFLGGPGAMYRNREQSAAVAGRCIRTSERSCAWHPQPSLWRTPAERRNRSYERSSVVAHAGPAPLTRLSDQETAEVRVDGERGHSPRAPTANGVHQARGIEATGCHSRSFGGGEAPTGVAGVSSRKRD